MDLHAEKEAFPKSQGVCPSFLLPSCPNKLLSIDDALTYPTHRILPPHEHVHSFTFFPLSSPICLLLPCEKASWKLQSWDTLDGFIDRLERGEKKREERDGLDRCRPKTQPLAESPYSSEDAFQISVGKLMQSMRKMNRKQFEKVLTDSRY